MKKATLYEILQVSENASEEIIEKAYKVLAKKYHPDLQQEADKKNAEAMMKKINEAYEILGNKEKRVEYDNQLQAERKQEEANTYTTDTQKANNNYTNINYNTNVVNNKNQNNNFDYEAEKLRYEKKLQQEELRQRKKMQENLNKEYENAYYNYLRSLGYKVKHKWTKQNFIDLIIVLAIMAIIFVILWFIPVTHDWMVNFYEENVILKNIVNIIIGIVTSIFTAIWTFITGIFS